MSRRSSCLFIIMVLTVSVLLFFASHHTVVMPTSARSGHRRKTAVEASLARAQIVDDDGGEEEAGAVDFDKNDEDHDESDENRNEMVAADDVRDMIHNEKEEESSGGRPLPHGDDLNTVLPTLLPPREKEDDKSSKCHFEQLGNISFVHEVPRVAATPPVLAFLAHGCSHGAIDFCPKSQVCPKCRVLPEEDKIWRAMLRRGYHVVAVSSMNRRSKCWSTAADTARVAQVLEMLGKRWWGAKKTVRLLTFGASSGGTFASDLAKYYLKLSVSSSEGPVTVQYDVSGVITQVAVPSGGFKATLRKLSVCVPVVMSIMSRDARMLSAAVSTGKSIKSGGCPRVSVMKSKPLSLSDDFFFERIPDTVASSALSRKMVDALITAGVVDGQSRMILKDPRRAAKAWRKALAPFGLKMGPDTSALSEEMNVAYGRHEMHSDGVDEWISFVMEG